MFELRVQFILERHATNCWRDGFLSCQRQLCPSITVGMVRDSPNKGMFLRRGWLERALSSFRATGSGSQLALSLRVASIFQRESFSHSAAFVLFSRGLFYKIPFVPRSSYLYHYTIVVFFRVSSRTPCIELVADVSVQLLRVHHLQGEHLMR